MGDVLVYHSSIFFVLQWKRKGSGNQRQNMVLRIPHQTLRSDPGIRKFLCRALGLLRWWRVSATAAGWFLRGVDDQWTWRVDQGGGGDEVVIDLVGGFVRIELLTIRAPIESKFLRSSIRTNSRIETNFNHVNRPPFIKNGTYLLPKKRNIIKYIY
jgi:hypothetical protein